ncbi:MAG: DUF4339 domain-containing protein [Flavobacteriales bacterium]|nr:DUF4339 domain-containing protein [Flavobacteriales bacterium]
MAFSEKDNVLRTLDDASLIEAAARVENKNVLHQVVLGDEMLRRKMPVTGLMRKYESLVRSLETRDLRYIDRYDYAFAVATVRCADHELNRRGVRRLQWYFLHDGHQEGPLSRKDMEEAVAQGQIVNEDLVWKEGEAEWVRLDECSALSTPYFFDEVREERKSVNINRPAGRQDSASAGVIAAGIMQLMSFPFWLIALIIVPFGSISTSLGMVLPTIFAASAFLMSIPLGVGILLRKHWAYSLKIGSGVLIIVWLLARIIVDDGSMFWMMYILAEVVILVLLFSIKEAFNTQVYESTH